MIKITKAKAKTLYDSGETICLNPSKMRLDNPWTNPMTVSKDERDDTTFESLVNSFRYYNCSSQTGNIVHFYKL